MPAILKDFLPFASLCDIASFGSYAKVGTVAEHDDLEHDEVSHLSRRMSLCDSVAGCRPRSSQWRAVGSL